MKKLILAFAIFAITTPAFAAKQKPKQQTIQQPQRIPVVTTIYYSTGNFLNGVGVYAWNLVKAPFEIFGIR